MSTRADVAVARYALPAALVVVAAAGGVLLVSRLGALAAAGVAVVLAAGTAIGALAADRARLRARAQRAEEAERGACARAEAAVQERDEALRRLTAARGAVEQGERREQETAVRLRDADRLRDEFLGSLAHELRNPLAPMRNALEIMRLAGHDSGAAERARALIERQLGQVVRLIDDLLDVSRVSLGRLELRRSRTDLAAAVTSAVERARPLVESSGHELTVSLPREPVYVDGDFDRLVQVFANLLSNASRFMEAGGRIRLAVRREDGRAVVRVEDSGVGIPADLLPHVFALFSERGHHARRSGSGLGMGLTLVKRLVELHDGTVEAHSEGPGRGSEFVVTLPAAPAPAPAPARPSAVRAAVGPVRRRVLVVDDNHDAATSLATMLRMMGHETLTAHDGGSALEIAATRRPQVVLLDIGMPGMSGYEVAAQIRRSSWGQAMTLVALTGWGQEEDRKRSREAGFDEHLVKPVHPEMLSGVLALAPPS